VGQGFIGDAAVEYFEAVEAALKRSKGLSNLSYGFIPDGQNGGFSTDKGNSTNIVIVDSSYNNGAKSLMQADERIEGRIRSVIGALEDVCNTVFRMPATTARVRVVLDEIRALLNRYSSPTVDAKSHVERFISEMASLDSGATRVYNSGDIDTHIANSDTEFSRQINALLDKKRELELTLQSRENSLSAAQTSLSSAQSSLTSAGSCAISAAALRNRVNVLQNNIQTLNTQIRDVKSQIAEIDLCIVFLNTTRREASTSVISLSDSAISTDSSSASGIERLCEQTMRYVQALQRLESSISIGMGAAVVKEQIGMVSCSDTLDTLIRVLAILEESDKIAIFEVVLDAKPPYRCLFFAFADKINITCINSPAFFYPPDSTLPCGTKALTPQIHFNVGTDRNNPRGPFASFFHEIGHMIDWYSGQGESFFTSSVSPDSQRLYDSLRMDVRNQLHIVANDILSSDLFNMPANMSRTVEAFYNQMRNQAIENIMEGKRVEAATNEIERLQLAIQDMMADVLHGSNINSMVNVWDISAGITNNAIHVPYTARDKKDFWFDENNNPTGAQQQEFFATQFRNAMLNDDASRANQEEFFGRSTGIMDEMIRDMASGIGG